MPAIFTNAPSPIGSALTPRVGVGSLSPSSSSPDLTPEQQQAITQNIFNTTYNENRQIPWYAGVAATVVGSAVDLGDTLISSMPSPLRPFGLAPERGDFWNLVGDYGGEIGSELKNYYEDNKSRIEMISGLAGAIGTGVVAGELLLPRIAGAMASSTAISSSRLWQAGAQMNVALRANMLAAKADAAANAMAFSLRANGAAGLKYYAGQAVKGAGKALFEEAAIGITMNQNEAIWSDEVSENLLFGGLGMGIGAGVGLLRGRYELRQLLNDPAMIKDRVDHIDPQGFTTVLESTPTSSAMQAAYRAGSNMKESANFTTLMLIARQADPANATPNMLRTMSNIRTNMESQAHSSLQKIAVKGVEGVPGSSFSVDPKADTMLRTHLTETTHSDPLALFGMSSMGVTKSVGIDSKSTPLENLLKDRDNYIYNLTHSQDPNDIARGRYLKKQQALYLVDRHWLPADSVYAKALSAYEPNLVKLTPSPTIPGTYRFVTKTGRVAKLSDRFKVQIGNGKGATDSSAFALVDRLQAREALNIMMKRMIRAGENHVVEAKPTWFQLDAAVEFEKRGGSVVWQKTGITDANAARLESLKLKADEILKTNANLGTEWDRIRFNLPLPSASERAYDGKGDLIRSILQGAKGGASYESLVDLRKQLMDMHGMELRTAEPTLDGEFFQFNLDEKGNWLTPVVGYFDSPAPTRQLNLASVAQANAEYKAQQLLSLMNLGQANRPGMVPDLVKSLLASPEYAQSKMVNGLADDQITGLGNAISQMTGEFLTREMRFRDNPILLSLLRNREMVNRFSDNYINELGQSLQPLTARLATRANASSKTLVNQFYSNAAGWDIEEAIPHSTSIGKGKSSYGFVLADTDHNAVRLGRRVQQDEFLVNPRTGVPIVVDDLGLEFINTFTEIAHTILADVNRVRVARGLRPLRAKKFYVPPPNTKGKHIAMTYDEFNTPVPGGGIIANTASELDDLIRKRLADPNFDPHHKIRTNEEVARAQDIYDLAAQDWIDPGIGARPQKIQTGALSTDVINPNAIGDILDWIRRQGEQLGTDTMKVLYDSQLGIVRARSVVERNMRGLKSDSPVRTIWDEYEATAMGWNLSDTRASFSGTVMRGVEEKTNRLIQSTWPAVSWMSPTQLGIWIGDLRQKLGITKGSSARSFAELSKELGPYMPYQSAVDYAEQTLKINRPPEIRAITQKMNQLQSALMLRYFEFAGMPALNMLGVITTLPSIARNGRAPISTYIGSGANKIGVVDTYKLMAQGFRDMLNQSKHPEWATMIRNGDTTQQVADFNVQMASITDRNTFDRVMMGTKEGKIKNVVDIRNLKDVKDIVKHKGIDGLISIATDSTENWSRTWSHFVGLRLADMQGITGVDARHSFAREIANAAIANYNPLNRPEVYQSAFGSLFGLFMSFMQSYNQRLFRWMEQGDYAAVGRQLAMQSSLFGIASNPGFNLVQDALIKMGLTDTESGDDATIIDHVYARFGPEIGSAIAHGGLAQLGVALYTRGDMNYREATLDPTKLAASLNTMVQVASGVKEAAESLFDPNRVDDNNRLVEILARTMPNRVMKGFLETVAMGGRSVDASGQIVTENRSFFETAIRMLGLRSTYQQGAVEAFYANKQMRQREAARMEVLREETRSLIRNNPNWQDSLQDLFTKYMENGGRPENYRTWIKDQIRSASTRRDINDLTRALRNPKNQLEVWRYGAYAPQ